MTETAAPTPAGPGSATPPVVAPGGDAPPPRRGRGRPFGSTTRKPPLTENSPEGTPPPAGQAEPAPRRRRSKVIDKEALAKQLEGLHEMAAMLTGLGFVRLAPAESAMLANAIEGVAREYDLELTGKTGAFINLVAAAAIVYGPRALKFKAVKAVAKAAQGVADAAVPSGPNGAVAEH